MIDGGDRIEVRIPALEAVLARACDVPLARDGVRWSGKCLREHAKLRGVYLIHHMGRLKYVGKTDGPTMDYATRLRREFQRRASGDRHNYPKLAALPVPPPIRLSFVTAEETRPLVVSESIGLSDEHRIAVMEMAMIAAFEPEWQPGTAGIAG